MPQPNLAIDDAPRGDIRSRIGVLAQLLTRHASTPGIHPTSIPGLSVVRHDQPSEVATQDWQKPSMCLVAQGRKRVLPGDEVLDYDPSHFLVYSVDLPVRANVVEARPDRPYLCLMLDIDPSEISALMLKFGTPAGAASGSGGGLHLNHTTAPMLDAVIRLVRLLDTPEDAGALAPLVVTEIYYRLLQGDEGGRLAQIAVPDHQTCRVCKAVGWLREHFAEPLRIERLAKEVHMSESSLHHHFRELTCMSPLQYQKQLRLQEARRLLHSEGAGASDAAYRVGYESPSQFSREYRRMFGASPIKDRTHLRREDSAPSLDLRAEAPDAVLV
jgi:AraC-like DNA-binding protein